ncbi:MAG: TerB family tellurite resistance protein [Desulfobacterales bacterium]|jgi:uncharacterized tellurite resistance protein B-like protein
MLNLIKRLLSATDEANEDAQGAQEHDLVLATCALLIEMARIDESFSPQETEAILQILKSKYGLSDAHAAALMDEADKELSESVDLWQFARLINENYSREEKIGVIETLWQVVFVDHKMDKYEDYLMHKMSKLLRISHKELIDAKLKIKHGNT